MMVGRTFHAMGTDVELLVDAEPGARTEDALDRAQGEFERLEQVLSRFREDSELSQLNRDGATQTASHDLIRVVEIALEAREATAGLFDPTIHDAVVAAGYDRSFEAVAPDTASIPAAPKAACGGEVRVDGTTIALEPGTRLDLGGIGKGYAADRVAEQLAVTGPCLVNAGGDLAVRGGTWPIGVTDGLTLELTRGGLATSGRDRRRWRRGGVERHHLIDPQTGMPAEGTPLRVTVIGSSAVEAEVAAKAAFLGAEIDLPHVVVTDDGSTVLAGGLR